MRTRRRWLRVLTGTALTLTGIAVIVIGVYVAFTEQNLKAAVMALMGAFIGMWIILSGWEILHAGDDDLYHELYGARGKTRATKGQSPDAMKFKYYAETKIEQRGFKKKNP